MAGGLLSRNKVADQFPQAERQGGFLASDRDPGAVGEQFSSVCGHLGIDLIAKPASNGCGAQKIEARAQHQPAIPRDRLAGGMSRCLVFARRSTSSSRRCASSPRPPDAVTTDLILPRISRRSPASEGMSSFSAAIAPRSSMARMAHCSRRTALKRSRVHWDAPQAADGEPRTNARR